MYEEKPLAVLILPPVNETTAADAKEYYSTTIQEPLAYRGYYTLPYVITEEILQGEGLYDTELLYNQPLQNFRDYFGADAVLFTRIKEWDMSYVVVSSSLTVSVDMDLRSTLTNESLWTYSGTVRADLSGGDTGGGLAGLIAKVIISAVNSATAEYVTYARKVNYTVLSSMPVGKYHGQFGKDQNVKIIDLTVEEE